MTDDHQDRTDGTSPDAPPDTPPRKGKGGAPKGSANALKHGLYSKNEQIQRRNDEFRTAAEAEVAGMLEQLHLEGDHLAKRIGRRLVQTEVESAVLERFVERRGRYQAKTGSLKPAYERMLDLRQRDLADCNKLLDRLAEVTPKPETTVNVRVHRDENDPTWFAGWCRTLHDDQALPISVVFTDGTYLERNAPDDAVVAAEATLRAEATQPPPPKPTAQERLSEAGKLEDDQDENPPPPRRNRDGWKRWCDGDDID